MIVQDEFTDDLIEPPEDALRRLSLRARLRTAWRKGQPGVTLAKALDIGSERLRHVLRQRFFGTAWDMASGLGVLAGRQRVRFIELPRAIARAEQLLADLAPPDSLAAD
jgi:16S rRNA G1207 methylase RsmC